MSNMKTLLISAAVTIACIAALKKFAPTTYTQILG